MIAFSKMLGRSMTRGEYIALVHNLHKIGKLSTKQLAEIEKSVNAPIRSAPKNKVRPELIELRKQMRARSRTK